jgi:hypothetical protein
MAEGAEVSPERVELLLAAFGCCDVFFTAEDAEEIAPQRAQKDWLQ